MRAYTTFLLVLLSGLLQAASVLPNEKAGKQTTGWDGALSVSFVHAGQHSVTGLAQVVVTGHSPNVTNPVDCISAAYFKYRWRRMDTVPHHEWGAESWETIPMVKAGPSLLATSREMTIPDFACDIEFYFVGTSLVPYYRYVDYSGRSLGVGGYTEEPQKLVVAHLKTTGDEVLGSCGKEWFVRVRDGQSLFQGVRVK